MKQVLIKVPKLCTRVGNVFTVRVDTGVDLTGTVLHQLHHEGEQPVFRIGTSRIVVPDLGNFELNVRTFYDGNGKRIGEVAELPDGLRVLDTFLGDTQNKRVTSKVKDARKRLLRTEISSIVQDKVLHVQSERPGMMGFALGSDAQLGNTEIAISIRQGVKFLKSLMAADDANAQELLEYCISRMSVADANTAKLVWACVKTDEELTDAAKQSIRDMAKALDGIAVYGLRYPNASSTSHELKTLRVYVDSPADAIHMRVQALVQRHQGDCDGDRLGFHTGSKVTPEFSKPPHPLHWKRDYRVAHNAFTLDDLVLSDEKSPIEIMDGFSERGRWVGMLTYNFWLLFFAFAHHYDKLGLTMPPMEPDEDPKAYKARCRAHVCPVVLDLFTPLIEGVMNARKGTGSGTSETGESLAQAVCDMFSGQRDIDEVLEMLPVNETGEYDEEKFTKEQVAFLRRGLNLIAGPTNARCRLNDSISGACQDPVLLAFALRFRDRATEFLLNQIPDDVDFHDIVARSLLVRGKQPWRDGKPVSARELSQRQRTDQEGWYSSESY